MAAGIAQGVMKFTEVVRIQDTVLNTASGVNAFTFHHELIHEDANLMNGKPIVRGSRSDSCNAIHVWPAMTQ